jgi:hypothetical protein
MTGFLAIACNKCCLDSAIGAVYYEMPGSGSDSANLFNFTGNKLFRLPLAIMHHLAAPATCQPCCLCVKLIRSHALTEKLGGYHEFSLPVAQVAHFAIARVALLLPLVGTPPATAASRIINSAAAA